MTDRPLHEVSVKILLYSYDAKRVVVMRYPHGKKGYPFIYGLPGGHVEANESPDEAMQREIVEELGVSLSNEPTRIDFFLRGEKGSAIILAYKAILAEGFTIQSPDPDEEMGVWMTLDEFKALDNISGEYKRIIMEHWPTLE